MFEHLLEAPVDDTSLAALGQCSREANAATARMVHAAGDVWGERMSVAASIEGADAMTVSRSAAAEVAVRVGCSHATAQAMVDTSQLLLFRAPQLDAAFRAGNLDYAKARTIAAVLADASDETIAALEPEAVAAAAHLTPGPLRAAVWRAWFRVNPDEAAEVRAGRRKTDRKVYVRRGDNGLSWLSACLTDLEGAEAAVLIDELAQSVCADDPRSRDNRRADALMALLHGEAYLSCRCGGRACPLAGTEPPRRRAHLLQILVDVETLLGLSGSPATLPDGTPLDPELVRTLAEDATWQAILTEMRMLAERTRETNPGEMGADAAAVARCVGRGRKHAAGRVPVAASHPVGSNGAGVGVLLERLHADVPGGPLPVPDGHGGHIGPPAGALRYQASDTVAELVRAAHPTCVFPGCTVAAARCELDHQVPFDHAAPMRGGWTIPENLAPLCKRHHQFKTQRLWSCTNLGGGAVFWRSRSGLSRITAPCSGRLANLAVEEAAEIQPAPRDSVVDPLTADEELDLLYEPTWWERHMCGAPAPPSHDTELRERWREHRAVARRRYLLAPPPF